MKTADFDFTLPDALIAQRPLKERSGSKLLVVHKNGMLEHQTFSDLPSYLGNGDILVINNTKVLPARLTCLKENGGTLDILLIRKKNDEEWEVLSKGNFTGPLKVSEELHLDLYKGATAQFRYSGNFMDVLWRCGSMPIPPYMKRSPDQSDKEHYQTTFAKEEGSIAAPTAGLHFTDTLFKDIDARGVKIREITLHVGIGTFKPIRAENLAEHSMDSEYFELDKQLLSEIEMAKSAGKRIVAVGTTTTRTLEGYASGNCSVVSQNGRLQGTTDMFIYPGYSFRIVDSLVTNFHLPRSTPLMLTSALAGREKLFSAYREAIANRYRFLSYGDAMLIL